MFVCPTVPVFDSSNACLLFSTVSCTRACAHALHSHPLRLESLTSTGQGQLSLYLFHRPPLTAAMGGCFLFHTTSCIRACIHAKMSRCLGTAVTQKTRGTSWLAMHRHQLSTTQFCHSAAQAKAASCQLDGLAFTTRTSSECLAGGKGCPPATGSCPVGKQASQRGVPVWYVTQTPCPAPLLQR